MPPEIVVCKQYSFGHSAVVFIHSAWLSAPQTLNISQVLRVIKVSFINEVDFWNPRTQAARRSNHGIRGLELSAPRLTSGEGKGPGGSVSQRPMIQSIVAMQRSLHKNPKGLGSEASGLVNSWRLGRVAVRRGHGSSTPVPQTAPCAPLHLAVDSTLCHTL